MDKKYSIEQELDNLRSGKRDRSDYETLIFLQNNYIELINDKPE